MREPDAREAIQSSTKPTSRITSLPWCVKAVSPPSPSIHPEINRARRRTNSQERANLAVCYLTEKAYSCLSSGRRLYSWGRTMSAVHRLNAVVFSAVVLILFCASIAVAQNRVVYRAAPVYRPPPPIIFRTVPVAPAPRINLNTAVSTPRMIQPQYPIQNPTQQRLPPAAVATMPTRIATNSPGTLSGQALNVGSASTTRTRVRATHTIERRWADSEICSDHESERHRPQWVSFAPQYASGSPGTMCGSGSGCGPASRRNGKLACRNPSYADSASRHTNRDIHLKRHVPWADRNFKSEFARFRSTQICSRRNLCGPR